MCKILFTVYIIYIVTFACTLISTTTVDVEEHMDKAGIVPDVLPVAPKEPLNVTYKGILEVNFGNELTPRDVKDTPKVEWHAEPNVYYTLCMTDPDAPSRDMPKFREWLHWLVVNIPENNINEGEILAPYIGSGPPRDTGFHRYVFVLYKQNDKTVFNKTFFDGKIADVRRCFKINEFAIKYNLGNPIAGNYYQAQYDDYVPVLHKLLHV